MATRKSTAPEEISEILKVTQGQFECCILGTAPLILNRMSEKAKHELLLPGGRKNAVQKATTLKHRPVEEYRASAYRLTDPAAPTLLALMSTAFKGALRSAAIDMPGAKKAQVGRLTYIEGDYVGIFGLPKLLMSIVRSADMNKTPDVRTRAIVPAWACRLVVTFVQPLIRAQAVANLLAAAGITIGVGDGRPEKGAMSYGRFEIVDSKDPRFLAVLKSGGRKAQTDSLETPVCYDSETAELLSWYDDELAKRTLKGVA
jgi:hypothetical protein